MTRHIRLRLTLGVILAGLMLGAGWLMTSDASPLNQYFLWHVSLPNVWRLLHIFPALLSAGISGNMHQGSDVAFIVGAFLQWLAVGWLVGTLLFRAKQRR